MFRSAKLLRPIAPALARSPALATPRPLALALQRQLQASSLLSQQRRTYADKPEDKPKDKPSGPVTANATENMRAGYQNETTSARQEARDVAKSFADIISGGNPQSAAAGAREQSMQVSHKGNAMEDFSSVTRTIFTSVPKPALYFGLAGTIPYLGTAVSTVFLAREASLASLGDGNITGLSLEDALSALHTLEHVQITYGAIILSFLGAIHWGMEFSGQGGHHGYRRLALGIVPVLIAWPTTFLDHGVALAAQWCGFTGMWFIDQRATMNGWTTSWYSTYRFYLSIIVGFSIIGTFAGTSLYGAGAGAVAHVPSAHHQHTTDRVSSMQRLDRVRERNFPPVDDPVRVGRREGKVGGDMKVEENEGADSYLVLKNVDKEEAKQREEEEEKRKKAEAQDRKEAHQQDRSPKGMKDHNQKDRTGANPNTGPNGESLSDDKQGMKKDVPTTGYEKGEDMEKPGKPGSQGPKTGDDKDEGSDGDDSDEDKQAEAKGNEGGAAGKSQQKQDKPDDKGAAGEKNTGKR